MKKISIFLMASICSWIGATVVYGQSQCQYTMSIDVYPDYGETCPGRSALFIASIRDPHPTEFASYYISWYIGSTLIGTGQSVLVPGASLIPSEMSSVTTTVRAVVEVWNSETCGNSATGILSTYQPPTVAGSSSFAACEGVPVDLTAATNMTAGGPNFSGTSWSGPSGTVSGGIFNPNGTLAPGTYALTYTAIGFAGCNTTKSVTATIDTKPVATILGDGRSIQFCPGQTVSLTATSTVPNSLFFWQTGLGALNCGTSGCGSTITTGFPGIYRVVAKNGACTSELSNFASLNQILVYTPSITQTGSLCTNGVATLTTPAATGPYGISPPTLTWNTGQTGSSINVYSPGNYYVVANFNNVCTRTSSTVSVVGCPPPPPDPCQSSISTARDGSSSSTSRLPCQNNLKETSTATAGVYPNPAKESFTVQLAEPVQEDIQVVMYDQLGGRTASAIIKAGTDHTMVSTSGLTNGIYLVQIQDHPQMKQKYYRVLLEQ